MVPSDATTSKLAPSAIAATGRRSVTSIEIVEGSDRETRADAIHGSRSRRRSTAPVRSQNTLVPRPTPARLITAAGPGCDAPETSTWRAANSGDLVTLQPETSSANPASAANVQ